MVGEFNENMLSDMLPIYYSRLFPQNVFCRWLSSGSIPEQLCNRELSFTLADDVYLRFLSISNQKELQTLLQKKCPHKIDIGAVYNTKPSIARTGSVVLSRELVFDIDLTDYDEIRTCCQEAKVCDKCWKFMVIACEIIDKSLKDDFGFQSILWVFSGRRGIHCWVSDYEARKLDGPGRSAVADYLGLVMGGEFQNKKVYLSGDHLHSSIRRALSLIDKYFEDILKDQQFFSTAEGLEKLLLLISDETLKALVKKNLEKLPDDSVERWKAFERTFHSYFKENGSSVRKMKHLIEEIKLQYCYPRLDVNVTRGFNHLLKSPFCVHPKTGKVCVVFKASNASSLRVSEVPSLAVLLGEGEDGGGVVGEGQAAALRASLALFQDVVFALEKAEALRRRRQTDASMEI